MSEILKRLYNACNPLRPATPPQYVDSDEARGSRDLSRQFLSELNNIEGDFLTFLFTGHLGCGKSSELHHLAEQLRNPDPRLNSPSYFPIILDAEEFIDTYDVTPTDVLLSILSRVAQELAKIGIELQDSFLWRRLEKVKDLLLTEIAAPKEIGVEGTFPLAKVTAKFPLLKSDPTNRDIVRKALGRDTSTLKSEIKHQFEMARGRLAHKECRKDKDGKPYRDIVLILDNLEKVDCVQGLGEGYISHRQFFLESASQLIDLGVHVIYTVPLPLVIADGPELGQRYGSMPFVLPMIKIEERAPERTRYEPGWKTLRDLVHKRVGLDTPLESVIDKGALDFLIGCSGGNTRQLLVFIKQAATLCDEAPIGLRAAQQAIADTVSLYSRMPKRYWEQLAALELSPDQDIDTADEGLKAMLKQLIVLEYRNGGAEDDPFNPSAPWYAVHPIVRALRPFKAAVKRLNG